MAEETEIKRKPDLSRHTSLADIVDLASNNDYHIMLLSDKNPEEGLPTKLVVATSDPVIARTLLLWVHALIKERDGEILTVH